MKMRVDGRTVLITGGSAGIGLATAEAFRAAGSEVIICGRDAARLQQAREIVPGIQAVRCDLARDEEIERLVATVRQDFPTLSILVNNAGVLHTNDVLAGTGGHQWITDEVRVNLIAPMALTSLLLPILQQQESSAIVIVSSGLALTPLASAPVYSATKAALHSFSHALRYRLNGTSVKVVEVLPPFVDTGMTRGLTAPKIAPETVARAIVRGIERDRHDVRIGQIRSLHLLSRLSPSFAERVLNRSLAE
jgi:short-subunit dehydrogenase involved in D-alanine esterification of teichoic acids